ncbi:MAG TPA: hypothetical protein VGK58_23200 [Lacipirellulaceae bacterium]
MRSSSVSVLVISRTIVSTGMPSIMIVPKNICLLAAAIRGNGGGRDLGYPRSVQRPDGKIVTVYYFHDEPKGDRYIAATIWEP